MQIKKIIFLLIIFNLFCNQIIFAQNTKQDILKIYIELDKRTYLELKNLSIRIKKSQMITEELKKKFNGQLLFKGKKYPIRLWLDGLSEEHFGGKNLSNNTFEIRLKNKKYILETKNFRILSKKAFRNDYPLYYNEILSYLGLPYRHIIPLNFSVNLRNKEKNLKNRYTHVLEEKIDKDFLIKNQLPESVIFEKDIYNKEYIEIIYKCRNRILKKEECIALNDENEKINRFKITKNKYDKDEAKYAIKIYKSYLDKTKKPAEVFEINQVAKILALHTILNNSHALADGNIKFYFNPKTKKILIIPTDPHRPFELKRGYENLSSTQKIVAKNFEFLRYDFFTSNNWFDNLLLDKYFVKQYLYQLHKMVDDKEFYAFLNDIDFFYFKKEEVEKINIIKKNIIFLRKKFNNK